MWNGIACVIFILLAGAAVIVGIATCSTIDAPNRDLFFVGLNGFTVGWCLCMALYCFGREIHKAIMDAGKKPA